jgi:putative photosynthetic complex assembly protein
MNAVTAEQKLPRGAIQGAGFMVVLALVLVAVARLTGYTPAQPPVSTVVDSFALRFEDRADGAVLVYDTADNELTYTIEPGTNGFVRGVLRGLVRERRADHIGPTPPFRLTRWADGRLSLDDPSTGRHVDLEVFGPTNAGDFATILLATAHHENKT